MKAPVKAPAGVMLNEDEDILYLMRTHPKILFLPAVCFVLAVALIVLSFVHIPMDALNGWLIGITLGIIVLASIKFSIWPAMSWWKTNFIVTTKQIIVTEGVLYKKKHSSQLSRVSDLNVERGILDRIFNCGTLIIFNASGGLNDAAVDMNRVTLHDVPKVFDVEQKIKDLVFNINYSDN